MHFVSTDLDFDALSFRSDDGGMNALIFIGLWCGNVVFETAWDAGIMIVDNAKRLVTIADRINKNTESHDIGKLFKPDIFARHFLPN